MIYCVFINRVHEDMKKPMYVDVYNGMMEIKCRHIDCMGKTCPMSINKINKK